MPAWTVRDALQWGADVLVETPSTTPRLDAELLLGHVTGRTRTQLMAWPEHPVSEIERTAFERLIKQRRQGVPVAYLTGRREFLDIELRVGPGALVPRPETEMLVEWADSFLHSACEVGGRIVIDVGTGPGTILLSLARRWQNPGVRFLGVDPSDDALKWARLNREELGLATSVDLVRGDLLDWFGGSALLVTANLPYLRADQIDGNWALAAEPHAALDGGRDGLELIERLIRSLPEKLSTAGGVALEIDPSQTEAIAALMATHLPWLNAEVHRDLAGFERLVTGSPRQ